MLLNCLFVNALIKTGDRHKAIYTVRSESHCALRLR